jgi:3-hydroxyisobutyrate dehydrogenase-like beta-hydroxyacid dehydrogenase
MSQRVVGVIGVGLVGSALAERFIRAGWHVCGYDLQAESLERLRARGGQVARSPDEVVAAADWIVLSLPTSEIATEVMTRIAHPLSGRFIVDTVTGEPAQKIALEAWLRERGARYLDATIAGSSTQILTGDVVVMTGGDEQTRVDCEELLQSFSARCFHLGPAGAGARMKLVVNLVLGLNRAVLAEGLCFAERCGVDPRLALEVLRAGPAYSRVIDTKGDRMLDGRFDPQARLAQHLKDVRLILAAGQENAAQLPLSERHAALLEQLVNDGCGDLDNSAVIKAFRQP